MGDNDVAELPFLRDLEPSSVHALLGVSTTQRVARGTVLFRAGDPPEDLFILIKGKVKLTRRARRQPAPPTVAAPGHLTTKDLRRQSVPSIRESVLWVMGPGEMFGEVSVFDRGARSTSAIAQTSCEVLRIPGDELRKLMLQRPDVGRAALWQLTGRLRRSDDRTASFVLSDVPGRLAQVLLGFADRFGVRTPAGLAVEHDLTQAELAQIVGASRESVNKALTDFESRGLLTARSRAVTLHDLDKLRARVD